MADLYDVVELTRDTATQLVTLATGVITISIAFAEKIIPAKTRTTVALLAASWCGYLFSVLFGVAVLLNLTGNAAIALDGGPDSLDRLRRQSGELGRPASGGSDSTAPRPGNPRPRTLSPYEPNVRFFLYGQVVLFGLSSAVLVAFGIVQIRRMPPRVTLD